MLRIRHTNAPAVGPARLWAEVDLDAVEGNLARLRRGLAPGCEIAAVVKANAYGHGDVQLARAALAAGAGRLAVGDAAEGARLRAAGIVAEIAILGPSAPADAALIAQHGLVPSVADTELAAALAAAARRPLDVEVEIDTGMRRHG